MTTTQTPSTGLHNWTLESAQEFIRKQHGDDSEVGQRVAAKMFELQTGVWHAAHLVMIERYDSGELPTAICEHCGGRADVRIGFHHLCAARAERGRPTPKLDVVPTAEQCPCTPCRKAFEAKYGAFGIGARGF